MYEVLEELNNKIKQVYRKLRLMTLKEWCLKSACSLYIHTPSQFHKHEYVYTKKKKRKRWEKRDMERESHVPAFFK